MPKSNVRSLQEGLELLAVPWGHEKVVGMATVLAEVTHAHPTTEDTKKKKMWRHQMPGAAEQMLEMRNRAHDRKVPEVLGMRLLTPALWSWTARRRQGLSGLPITNAQYLCIRLGTCLGVVGKGCDCLPCLLSISTPHPPFQRVSLTAATEANRHWPLPGVKDIVLLSLAWSKLSRAPLSKIWVASSKRWWKAPDQVAEVATPLQKNFHHSWAEGTAIAIGCYYWGKKQPENLALSYYYIKGLPYNVTYETMKSKPRFF